MSLCDYLSLIGKVPNCILLSYLSVSKIFKICWRGKSIIDLSTLVHMQASLTAHVILKTQNKNYRNSISTT